jgi:hypothetical protein
MKIVTALMILFLLAGVGIQAAGSRRIQHSYQDVDDEPEFLSPLIDHLL